MATGPQNFKEKELTAFTARGHDFSDCSEREREWEGEEGGVERVRGAVLRSSVTSQMQKAFTGSHCINLSL